MDTTEEGPDRDDAADGAPIVRGASEVEIHPDWEAFYRDYRKPGYIEGFEITSKLGGGMFGLVFRARRMSIGKDYAIKFLKVDDGAVRRAVLSELEQVKYFAQIDHPNLVSIEDRGEVSGIPFLVMAFAGTETMRDLMTEGRAPAADEKQLLMRAFLECCRALQALHERSLVHFDIKPANVFLKGGVARLGDYGLSKLVTHSRGSLSMGRGTPYYMAPEMLQRRGDARSDIYSLGVMLYEILCGKVPFTGDSEWEVLRKHENARPDLPAQLTAVERGVLLRCLAKDPGDRFESVADLMAAFGTLSPVDGVPLSMTAKPVGFEAAAAEAPPLPGCLPPPLPSLVGPPSIGKVAKPAAAVAGTSLPPPPPPLLGKAAATRREARDRYAGKRPGSRINFGFVGLFAVLVCATLALLFMVRTSASLSAVAQESIVTAQKSQPRDLGSQVAQTVNAALKKGRRAAQRNRPQRLRELDLDRIEVPDDFFVCRQIVEPIVRTPRFVPALASRIESVGRPALLCAVAMLQELDYRDGHACQQAANLQRLLRQMTGIDSLTVEISGAEPSARETCMFLAVADGWRLVAERYVQDDASFERLLRTNGKRAFAVDAVLPR